MRGLGIDIVDVDRFAAVLARRPRIVERLFTEGELRDAKGSPRRLAARFAAKEACLKSLRVGVGAAAWRDIEVVRAPDGSPSLALHEAASALARSRGVSELHVSLSHSDLSACAVVVGL
jgi:holo-[acyl-carrier protein] synthase